MCLKLFLLLCVLFQLIFCINGVMSYAAWNELKPCIIAYVYETVAPCAMFQCIVCYY